MNKRSLDLEILFENQHWYAVVEITRESKKLDKLGKSWIGYQDEECWTFSGTCLRSLHSSICAASDMILKALSDHGFYVSCDVAFIPGKLGRVTPWMDTEKYLSWGGDLAGLTGLDETHNTDMEIFALVRVLSETRHYGRSYFKVSE